MKFFTKLCLLLIFVLLKHSNYLTTCRINLKRFNRSPPKESSIILNKKNELPQNTNKKSNFNQIDDLLNKQSNSNFSYQKVGTELVKVIVDQYKNMNTELENFKNNFSSQQKELRETMKERLDLRRKETYSKMMDIINIKDVSQMGESELEPLVQLFINQQNTEISKSKLPENSNWLGLGYNIMTGSPIIPPSNQKLLDPGISSRIFKLQEDSGRTYDDIYIMPKGIDIEETNLCQASFTSEIIKSFDQLTESSIKSLGININYITLGGSVNKELSNIKESMIANGNALIKNEAVCTLYRAIINPYNPPEFTDNFLYGLNELNNNPINEGVKNEPEFKKKFEIYEKFTNTFGTGYMRITTMGSRYTLIQEISNQIINDLESNSKSISSIAEFNSFIFSAKLTKESSETETKTKEYVNNLSKMYITSIGAPLPADMKMERWMTSTKYQPQPISYEIELFTDMLKNKVIVKKLNMKNPNMKIDTILNSLKFFMENYCNLIKNLRNIDCFKEYKIYENKLYESGTFNLLPNYQNYPDSTYENLINFNCGNNGAINKIMLIKKNEKDYNFKYNCIRSNLISNSCRKQFQNLNVDRGLLSFLTINISCGNNEVISNINQEKKEKSNKLLFTCCYVSSSKQNLEKNYDGFVNIVNGKCNIDDLLKKEIYADTDYSGFNSIRSEVKFDTENIKGNTVLNLKTLDLVKPLI